MDLDFTKTEESALDVGKIFGKEKEEEKPKKNTKPVTKESVDKKIEAMENLDLDKILNGSGDFKIWKKFKK